MTSTRNDKAIKIDKLKNPDIANPSLRKFYIRDKCIIWSMSSRTLRIPIIWQFCAISILRLFSIPHIQNHLYLRICEHCRSEVLTRAWAVRTTLNIVKTTQYASWPRKKTYCVTSPMFTFPIAWAELRNASSFMDVTMMIFELIPGGNVIRCYYCRLIGTRISVGHCQQALWEAAFKCR